VEHRRAVGAVGGAGRGGGWLRAEATAPGGTAGCPASVEVGAGRAAERRFPGCPGGGLRA
jgi:hypothetical protein